MDLLEMNEQGKYMLEETSSNGYWVASPKDKSRMYGHVYSPKLPLLDVLKKYIFRELGNEVDHKT